MKSIKSPNKLEHIFDYALMMPRKDLTILVDTFWGKQSSIFPLWKRFGIWWLGGLKADNMVEPICSGPAGLV